VAFSKYGNKLHIYSLEDFNLKFCIYLLDHEQIILNTCINPKSRFISTLSYDGTDIHVNLYDLKKINSEDRLCQCDDHDDSKIKLISVLPETKHHYYSYFGSFVSKLANINIFSGHKKPYSQIKLSFNNYIHSLLSFYLTVPQACYFSPFIFNFHHFHKDELIIIQISGEAICLKFDKKEEGSLLIEKVLNWKI